MITIDDYKSYLSAKGSHLGEVRKNRADMIMNATFKGDIGYRRVYILDPINGWKYTDAKFSRHALVSTSKDGVDSYLQFRPKEHYPIGCYVFIPDDTSYELEINKEDPLYEGADNLWLIVERTDNRQFVQYLVLKCNWRFKWITGIGDKRVVQYCWGCVRDAKSYTSGIWTDFRVTTIDNITSAWLPDTFNVYKDVEKYHLSDTRTIKHQIRFMITHNQINPKCWMVSKADDTTPAGIVKLTFKQDEYIPQRDNPTLLICDYYTNSGDIVVDADIPEPITSTIRYMVVNADGELEQSDSPIPSLQTGETYYFSADTPEWRITLVGDYPEEERLALEKLMVMRNVDSSTISLRPGKSNRIKGLQFILSANDEEGAIILEVAE